MGKVYDVDNLLAQVNNDKDTHKDKYKDKEKRKVLRRKGSCLKAKLLCVAIYLWIHQSFAQLTMSISSTIRNVLLVQDGLPNFKGLLKPFDPCKVIILKL